MSKPASPGRESEATFSQVPSPLKDSVGERLAVFVPDDRHVWLSATCDAASVCDQDGNIEFEIDDSSLGKGNTERRLLSVDIKSLPLHNINIGDHGVEDMCDLGFLHEASILDNLRRRFTHQLPYTRSGEICIAVNPYQWLERFYTEQAMDSYRDKLRHELPPHAFATSAQAYRGLRESGRNQSILVSGESGAGKTETVKIMLNMLAHVASPSTPAQSPSPQSQSQLSNNNSNSNRSVVQRIVAANPLLESFGNAKTARNDNSSRFGKFTELQFDGSSTRSLRGSKCTTYLLEKSRVVVQNDQHERNYHVFHQLLAHLRERQGNASSSSSTSTEPVLRAADFKYMSGGDLRTSCIEGCSDADGYRRTLGALSLLGIRENLQAMVEDVLLGILHLGEVDFTTPSIDGGSSSGSSSGSDCLHIDSSTARAGRNLVRLRALLGIDSTDDINALHQHLTTRSIHDHGDAQGTAATIAVPLSLEQAHTGKDALAKEVYARLFQWLVVAINFTTTSNASADTGTEAAAGKARGSSLGLEDEDFSTGFDGFGSGGGGTHDSDAVKCGTTTGGTIALLDIFGFESFKTNRFEQLCINYANEKLQGKFCLDCFRTVQQEYRDEGLRWESVPYNDNAETLQLLEGRSGSSAGVSNLMSLLNEECMLGARGSDKGFLGKAKNSFSGGCNGGGKAATQPGHRSFSLNIKNPDSFVVHHYAGRVQYNTAQFCEKNRDTCPFEMHGVLAKSTNPLLATLFGPNGSYFTGSGLHDLLAHQDRESAAHVLLLHQDRIPEEQVQADGSVSTQLPTLKAAPAVVPRLRPSASLLSRSSGSAEPTRGPGRPRRASFLSAETVTSKFKSQLGSLLDTLGQTQCQYVRCIKPNVHKSSTEYNLPMVVSQLRSAGMIEAVRISRAAYPYRTTHADFIARFKALRSSLWHRENKGSSASGDGEIRAHASALLHDILGKQPVPVVLTSGLGRDDSTASASASASAGAESSTVPTSMWEIGRTKLYFTAGVLEHLESLRSNLVHTHVCTLQAVYRGSSARRKYQGMRRASILLQSVARARRAAAAFQACRRAAIRVQAAVRTVLAVQYTTGLRRSSSASNIASAYRMHVACRSYNRVVLPACRRIQACFRGHSARGSYVARLAAAKKAADINERLHSAAEEVESLQEEVRERETAWEALAAENARLTLENRQLLQKLELLEEANVVVGPSADTSATVTSVEQGVGAPALSLDSCVTLQQLSDTESQTDSVDAALPPVPPVVRFATESTESGIEIDADAAKMLRRAVAQARSEGMDWGHLLTLEKAADSDSNTKTVQEQEQAQHAAAAVATQGQDAESPPARIRKTDVKETLLLMDAGGLACTIYAVQKRGGALVGKPAVLKKKADADVPGGGRIDCEVRIPAMASANGFTGVFGSTPMKSRTNSTSAGYAHTGASRGMDGRMDASADIITENHPAVATTAGTAAATIKVLRFAISDIQQVRRGRCGLMQLPNAVGDSACLVVTVRNKGELNFVLDSKHRCEVAYVAFHYLMQRCRATPDNTPSPVPQTRAMAGAASPLPATSPSRSYGKLTKTNIAAAAVSHHLSPTRQSGATGSSGFTSPLIERAQHLSSAAHKQRREELAVASHSRSSMQAKHDPVEIAQDAALPLPAPPALPFGTVLVSPVKHKRERAAAAQELRGRATTAGAGTSASALVVDTATIDKENTPRSRSRINADRGSLSPAGRNSNKDNASLRLGKASLSLEADLRVQAALQHADSFISTDIASASEALSPARTTAARVSKKGWVSKDSGVAGLSTPHWQRRFLMLERESRLLKFSNSELAEHYPSQVRGLVALHPATTTIQVTKATQAGAFSSYFSGSAATANLLEVRSRAGQGQEVTIRLQFETIGELSSWQRAIEDVMAGVR